MPPDEDKATERPGSTDEMIVSAEEDSLRLDQLLVNRIEGHSRGFFQRLIRNGLVRVNGRTCRSSFTVHTDQSVTVAWPDETPYELEGQDVEFDIIYEDEDILVINKPPGLVVHPAQGNLSGTLVHGLMFHDEETFSEMADESFRPGIVHRLDKDTSGVMVVAKSLAARRTLKESFKERSVEKTYLTIVAGEFGAITGVIETQIGRHPRNRTKMAVVPEGGKYALTKYRILGASEGCSLVEVRIFTGRTHQIRVHFSNLRHPVLGDSLYGGRQKDVPFMPKRQMLHAWKLVIPHPTTGVMRQYMAPLPGDFTEALSELGLPMVGGHAKDENEFRQQQIVVGRTVCESEDASRVD